MTTIQYSVGENSHTIQHWNSQTAYRRCAHMLAPYGVTIPEGDLDDDIICSSIDAAGLAEKIIFVRGIRPR